MNEWSGYMFARKRIDMSGSVYATSTNGNGDEVATDFGYRIDRSGGSMKVRFGKADIPLNDPRFAEAFAQEHSWMIRENELDRLRARFVEAHGTEAAMPPPPPPAAPRFTASADERPCPYCIGTGEDLDGFECGFCDGTGVALD